MNCVNELFGIESVQTVIHFGQQYVSATQLSPRRLLDCLAVFGDAELSRIVMRQLWQQACHLNNVSSKGTLSVQRALYVCNQSLALFLQRTTTLGAALSDDAMMLQELFSIDRSSNCHSWGTVFEALLWISCIEDAERATVVVQKLMLWVDLNVDPAQKTRLLADGDSAIDAISQTAWEVLFPVRRNRSAAPLRWARLTDSVQAASRADLASHDFDRNAISSQSSTIAGSWASNHNWQGTFCRACRAMLVVRRVSNSRSDYFIIGLAQCPQRSLVDWLDDYVQQYARRELTIDDDIKVSEFETWILLDHPRDDLCCTRCGSVYSYTKCSNTSPCRRDRCSLKYRCGLERKYCSVCRPL